MTHLATPYPVVLGGSAKRVCVSQHAMEQTPPPGTEFLTHACENITFPQILLQAVTRMHSSRMRTDWCRCQYRGRARSSSEQV